MKKKFFTAVVLFLLLAGSLGGCSFGKKPGGGNENVSAGEENDNTEDLVLEDKESQGAADEADEETGNGSDEDGEKIRIGVVFDSLKMERRGTEQIVLRETAEELGASLSIVNAEGDVEKQKEQIRSFTDECVHVIVVVPVDCTALNQEISEARNQGIFVISYERLIEGEQTDLFVEADSYMAGEQIADELKDCLTEGGNIVTIWGPENDRSSRNTAETMKDSLEDGLEDSSWEITYEVWAASWGQEDERKAVEDALANAGDQIDAVVCATDQMAGAAIEILAESGRAEGVLIIGQNAEKEAQERIEAGTQTMSISKPVEELAKKTVEYAVQMAEGKNLSGTLVEETEESGQQELMIPCYRAETTVVR